MYNIFVGNLSPTTSEHSLRTLFEPFGHVQSVTVVTDRDSGGPRGFAFVEMRNEAEANQAINAIDGTVVDDHRLEVNEARAKENKDTPIDGEMRSHRKHRY